MTSIDPTPFLVNSTSPETAAETVRAAGLRQAARMIRRASTGRRAMREPSMAVRETAAREIEDRQVDWAYSRPVVVLDATWNSAFVAAAAAALWLTRGNALRLPLRLWIVGYAVQCLVHVVCVCVEFRRRQRLRNRVIVNDSSEDLADESSSFIRHLESGNTMFSFVWWLIGFYWVFVGGHALQQDSPMLYWLCVAFLVLDLFFVIFCVALASVIAAAVCCCLPCIIAILYVLADHAGASKEDIELLSKYTFHKFGGEEKSTEQSQEAACGGVMRECGTDSPRERRLNAEDAIGEVSGSLILDWVMSQHAYILDWIGRAFELEEWEPLSSQQKHAVSVVEVFRMIEETIDQFFGLKLPVNITHLQALLSVVIHSLDAYLTKVVSQLVEKSHLYPLAPSLTRYEESLVPVPRKKLNEAKILDESTTDSLRKLTIPKLCIRLNTLQYLKSQIGVLEDGMRKSWRLIRPSVKRSWFNKVEEETSEVQERTMSMTEESIDELFATTFDGIRNSVVDAITKLIDFTGTKAVFWDLREGFLLNLYRGGVEKVRMDTVLPNVDSALNQICGSIEEVIRDPVVLSIFRSLLEGYIWILLDGGPSRAFSDLDVTLMEDDLTALKDFFVAEGEGLPRSTVERESKFAHQILSLFSLQTNTVIQMLMAASENIATSHKTYRSLDHADTYIRVLCHKKDREASKFLKKQYQLPPSSDYEENPSNESFSSSAIISDLLKRSASFRFPESGHNSFKSLKKKFQDAW